MKLSLGEWIENYSIKRQSDRVDIVDSNGGLIVGNMSPKLSDFEVYEKGYHIMEKAIEKIYQQIEQDRAIKEVNKIING